MLSDPLTASEIPIFVLNADEACERLVAVWADAERLGLRLVRVGLPAVAHDADPRGEKLRAHLEAWRRIAEGGNDFAIVVEDDVGLDERLLPLLNTARLWREVGDRAVLDLAGGSSLPSGPSCVVRASSGEWVPEAYLIGRETARLLHLLSDGASSIDALSTHVRSEGVSFLVAEPSPVAGRVRSVGTDARKGWARRVWSRLRRDRGPAVPPANTGAVGSPFDTR